MFNEIRSEDPSTHSRRTQQYLCKKKTYELWLTEEWINENLKYRSFSYPQITPSEIVTGSEKPVSRTRLIDNNIGGYALKRRLGIVIFMITITAIFEALTFTGSPFDIALWATLAFKLLLIAVNIFSGWLAGLDGFKKKKLNSAYIRQDLLVVYADWRETKSFKKLEKIENEQN